MGIKGDTHKYDSQAMMQVLVTMTACHMKMKQHRSEIVVIMRELTKAEDMFSGTRAETYKENLRIIDAFLEKMSTALDTLKNAVNNLNIDGVKLDKAAAQELATLEKNKKNKNKKLKD